MTFQAYLAIKAAKGYKLWGKDAARRFIWNRCVDPRLVRIARQCEVEIPFRRVSDNV